ncbi:hypothetical protein AB0F96_28865 [Streptomyces sp. NPDC023998]|uniref:hypothetical protein n=1 Tax=Streptomyces sp. NPDC023998 TaxID=3154597 RepID=UPI0033D142FC
MSDVINPSEIPQFTGDLEQLETDTLLLTADAVHFRTSGALVHSEFQGLSAFYSAPEAEKLFATTAPVKTDSDFFADQLETVSSALDAYATEVRPLAAKLKRLKEEATTFVGDIRGDEHWKDDEDKVDKNNDLLHDVNSTVAAFWEAERSCANKITSLFCGTHYVVDDGSHGKNMYGFKGDDLDNAEGVPWGSKVEESHRWWEIGHWVKSFVWDGIIVDGIWGTIRGLGTLVGVDGWDAAGQAWTGLAKLGTGLGITILPGMAVPYWTAPDDKLPSWLRESRTAVKETGKALVAWDEWGKNPARAAGGVTFNVVTTVFTGGTGAAAKGGAVAKAVSVVGKAGRLIDPITYIGKAGKFATVKVGDLFANLKKVNAGVYTDLAAGKFNLPENAVVLPDNTVKLVNPEGRTVYLNSETGALLDQNGKVVQNIDDIPREVSAAERGADRTPTAPPREPVTVGAREPVNVGGREPVAVGAHTDDNAASSSAAHAGDNLPGSGANHLPGGGVNHLPGGTAGHMPGGSADDLGRGPSASHEPPTGPPRDPSPPHGNNGTGGNTHGTDGPHRGEGSTPAGHADDGAGRAGDGEGGSHSNHDGVGTGGDHSGAGDGPGSGGHASGDGSPGMHDGRYTEGDRAATQSTGAMRPDQESAVTEALDRSKMQAQDQQRLLTQLRKSDYGAGVADYIARGNFADLPGYKDLIFQCKQSDMIPAVHQAMVHADELQASGVKGLEFEYKKAEDKLDLDVLVRSGDKIEYGWQLKDVQSASGIGSAVKKIAAKQLAGPGVGHKIAILDVHDVKASLTDDILQKVEGAARRTNAAFELRFQDGSITVAPPGRAIP